MNRIQELTNSLKNSLHCIAIIFVLPVDTGISHVFMACYNEYLLCNLGRKHKRNYMYKLINHIHVFQHDDSIMKVNPVGTTLIQVKKVTCTVMIR